MKKVAFLFFLVSFTISAQKIDKKAVYNYSDDVEFTIRNIFKYRAVDRGNTAMNIWAVSEKGGRFIKIYFSFKNKSSEKQIIDFEEFFILDDRLQRHEVSTVAMDLKLATSMTVYKQKLRPGAKRNIHVHFKIPFPKEEKIRTLFIGDKSYTIQYLED